MINQNLTTSDIIQLISICVALILGLVSIIISIAALIQNSKVIKQSNMAQIEIFPLKIYNNIVPRIKIQNFGKTTGTITNVKVTPDIPDNIETSPFEYYVGLSLAPNQSFTSVFARPVDAEPPLTEFDVEITYKTLGKTVKTKHHINYKFLDGCYETTSTPKDINRELCNINQSIQGLLQK